MIKLLVFLFILAAISIGVTMYDSGADIELIENITAQANLQLENINLTVPEESTIPNAAGMYNVLEKYIQFVGAFYFEGLEAGARFGYDNPEYFNPQLIFKVIILIIIFFLVSLLIKPVGYVFIFLIMIFMWIRDKIKSSEGD